MPSTSACFFLPVSVCPEVEITLKCKRGKTNKAEGGRSPKCCAFARAASRLPGRSRKRRPSLEKARKRAGEEQGGGSGVPGTEGGRGAARETQPPWKVHSRTQFAISATCISHANEEGFPEAGLGWAGRARGSAERGAERGSGFSTSGSEEPGALRQHLLPPAPPRRMDAALGQTVHQD